MEGFGIVMLEAGQCGCPVVASRLEGIQDVVTNGVNGQLVEPEDPEAFAEAIRVYCDHPERLQPDAERAATHVAHAFGWRAVADQYVETLAACRPGGTTANLAAANS